MNGKDVVGNMKELLFVYKADSTPLAQFTDLLIKLFAPKKYSCNLCLITYGMLRMKRAWKVFVDQLPHNVRFLHRDEFRDRHGENSDLPAAFIVENGELVPLITAREINGVRLVSELIDLVKQRLSHED
jgi:hypothetical protein